MGLDVTLMVVAPRAGDAPSMWAVVQLHMRDGMSGVCEGWVENSSHSRVRKA